MEQEQTFCSFPMLGTTADGETFEYLLMSMHPAFVEIAIVDWLTRRVKLHIGDNVELHIPTLLRSAATMTDSIPHMVVSIEQTDQMQGEIILISQNTQILHEKPSGTSWQLLTEKIPLNTFNVDLLKFLIKDSLILKQGVIIYLKHLIPYFSRIVNYPQKEYQNLKDFFFHDLLKRVNENAAKLEVLTKNINDSLKNFEELPIYLDMETLREILESEISLNLFNVMFADPGMESSQSNSGFAMYINAIKSLERRLYANYNHIVIIFLRSLTEKLFTA